ncbi:MAG TPA: hypothetical protein VHM00_11190 [Caldimonas sp.]|jgi:hypothetical protein|nr:hypothetical protein [Caldimonas sp.]HEX2541632.1 hypothetical protein [Caldimonas sp.]
MASRRLILATLLAFAAVACGGGQSSAGADPLGAERRLAQAGNKAPAGKAVVVTLPATTQAVVGSPVQLVAQVRDKNGRPVSGVVLVWASSDASIATVSSGGLLTPLRAGSTTVTASASGSTATTLVSVVEPSSTSARSRYVGTNLAGIAYWGTQFPFADLMKNSGGWWSLEDNGTWHAPFPAMTADGYPASLKAGQHAVAAVAWDNSGYAPGRYVVLWDGEGTISFPMSAVKVAETSGNRIAIDVSVTTGQLWVSIDRTSATNPVRNLRFLWPGTEATYATNPFNPVFLKKAAPFSTLRFMDWGGTNGSPVVHWSDRSKVSDLTYANHNGVPLEVMIDLANTLGVDPWFCIPHQATDDYVRQFAALLHSRLDPTLKPHIEYSNEVWNLAFPQATWGVAESARLGLPAPHGMPSAFYAQRSVEVFKLMQHVYGSDSGRLVRVIAGQAVWTQFLENALLWKDTAVNADVLSIAPYFGAGPADDAANVAKTLTMSSDQIVDLMFANVRGPVRDMMVANAALARRYGLRFTAYESGAGNHSSYFPPDKIDAMTALFSSAHRNPRMRDVYLEYYRLWVASGGDTMNQYHDIGPWSKWGLWGALERVTQDPATAPKYRGLLDFIAANPTPR